MSPLEYTVYLLDEGIGLLHPHTRTQHGHGSREMTMVLGTRSRSRFARSPEVKKKSPDNACQRHGSHPMGSDQRCEATKERSHVLRKPCSPVSDVLPHLLTSRVIELLHRCCGSLNRGLCIFGRAQFTTFEVHKLHRLLNLAHLPRKSVVQLNCISAPALGRAKPRDKNRA